MLRRKGRGLDMRERNKEKRVQETNVGGNAYKARLFHLLRGSCSISSFL